MAFGTLGSTLNDELNRLANGGTYRDMDDMVDEALAAKQWANRENIVPYSTDTVGILNEIAALGPNRQNWFDFNGVCNYLAGTTGLPAAAALRQITTTGDILTSLAAFYVDAVDSQLNGGFLYLPGVASNYASAPDSSALDITGDIDIRAKVALDTWTPAVFTSLVAKLGASGNRSYRLAINTDGTVNAYCTSDGNTAIEANSTVATGILNGVTKWIRAVIDVNNGASGKDFIFYTSDNGTTWTQLGTTVTQAGTVSIYNSTTPLEIGSQVSGTAPAKGKFYRAQVLNGIGGTVAFDANFETAMTSQTVASFTESSANAATVTINRTTYNFQLDTLTNGGSAGSLLPVTVGSSLAADSNDAKFLAHDGTNYVYLTGVASNNLSIPSSTALNITGDMDLRAYISSDNWANGATFQEVISKWDTTANTRQYALVVDTLGKLQLIYSTDGIVGVTSATSSVAVPFANGSLGWIRATRAQAAGEIKFYTSTDGTNWTQLGTTITGVTTSNFFTSSTPVMLGNNPTNSRMLIGKLYRAQIFNGIDGTKVLDVDTSVITSGADTYVVPTTYTGQAGAYFTGSGLSLNGVSGNYASSPDSAALDITGDIDIQCKVALTDWTPAAASNIIGKWDPAGNQYSYTLQVNPSGTLQLYWTTSGAAGTVASATSTVATGIADGATKWIRAALDVNNGASGNTTTFYLSDDGTTWTQLGSPVVNAGVTSIYSGTALLTIGATATGASLTAGTFYEAIVKSGIDGYTVFDADFTQVPANALRMTESSTNRAVVTLNTTRYATINRSTSGRKTVAVTQPTWLFGTDDYMEVNNRYMAHSTSDENYVYLSGASGNCLTVADNPPLDITGDLDIQVRAALDDWTPASNQALLYKWGNAGTRSYAFLVGPGGLISLYWTPDGSTSLFANSTVAPTVADGGTLWVRATLDVDNGASGKTVTFYTSTNGNTWTQLGSAVTTAGTTSIYSGSAQVTIGADSNVGTPAKGAFYRAIIKNGIDGTTVLDANAAVITSPSQTTFTDSSSNAYTVTINKSGVGTFVSTGNYLYLPGIASNYASSPDSAALDITGDLDLRVKAAMDDWTPSSTNMLLSKYSSTAGGLRSYQLMLSASGFLNLQWSTDGSTLTNNIASTAVVTFADGAIGWVRATLDVDNGASGNTVTFFTSTNGLTWTQLGSAVTTAGVTSIFSGGAQLEVGTRNVGTAEPSRGKFFRAQVYNGIGGTLAFDANFESSITSLNQASFTESSSNAATVTINRSGSAYRSAGVIDAGYLYPGATNTFTNSTTSFLDFGASDSFTAIAVIRQWNTPVSYGRYLAKNNSAINFLAYGMMPDATNLRLWAIIRDTGAEVNAGTVNYTAGSTSMIGMVVNRTEQTLTGYVNTTAGTATSIATKGSIATETTATFNIGRQNAGSNQDFEFVSAAIFRSVLTPAQIRQISNYFTNREAYL